MSDTQFIAQAAAPWMEIIRNIRSEQLRAQTPCSEWDVCMLVNHLLFWGPALEGAARKESVSTPAESEADADLVVGDWPAPLEAHLKRIVAAWSEPEAWEGSTQMGGPMDLPASMIGSMTVGELVVHGWDLARATGQDPVWNEGLLQYLYDEVAKSAEQGREMGVYGPEVSVPATSPMLDRVLGLTGRNPAWAP
jgi:uncharacterized protein (TIGR03086 family)